MTIIWYAVILGYLVKLVLLVYKCLWPDVLEAHWMLRNQN